MYIKCYLTIQHLKDVVNSNTSLLTASETVDNHTIQHKHQKQMTSPDRRVNHRIRTWKMILYLYQQQHGGIQQYRHRKQEMSTTHSTGHISLSALTNTTRICHLLQSQSECHSMNVTVYQSPFSKVQQCGIHMYRTQSEYQLRIWMFFDVVQAVTNTATATSTTSTTTTHP